MREEEFRLEEGLEEGGVYSRDNTSPHDAPFPAGSRVCRSLTRYEPPRSGSCASSVACAPLANPCVIFADSAPPLPASADAYCFRREVYDFALAR
jgi:hypothetical protein